MTFILGIIPARGGSKGIPQKNIALVGGRPLIAYTIDAAKGSQRLNDFIISTDSEAIAKCAAMCGLNCNSLRPAALATDNAKSIDVVIHEILQYEEKNSLTVDIVVLLQPTVPTRTSKDIDNSVELFLLQEAESLISVYDVKSTHPSVMYYLNEGLLSPVLEEGKQMRRRQDFQPVYMRNGALYIATRSLIMEKHTLVNENPLAYIMPQERSVNIDEPFDLMVADCLISQTKNDQP